MKRYSIFEFAIIFLFNFILNTKCYSSSVVRCDEKHSDWIRDFTHSDRCYTPWTDLYFSPSPTSPTPLHIACAQNNLSKVIELFQNPVTINHINLVDGNLYYPVQYLLENQNIEGIKIFINTGCYIHLFDIHRIRPQWPYVDYDFKKVNLKAQKSFVEYFGQEFDTFFDYLLTHGSHQDLRDILESSIDNIDLRTLSIILKKKPKYLKCLIEWKLPQKDLTIMEYVLDRIEGNIQYSVSSIESMSIEELLVKEPKNLHLSHCPQLVIVELLLELRAQFPSNSYFIERRTPKLYENYFYKNINWFPRRNFLMFIVMAGFVSTKNKKSMVPVLYRYNCVSKVFELRELVCLIMCYI